MCYINPYIDLFILNNIFGGGGDGDGGGGDGGGGGGGDDDGGGGSGDGDDGGRWWWWLWTVFVVHSLRRFLVFLEQLKHTHWLEDVFPQELSKFLVILVFTVKHQLQVIASSTSGGRATPYSFDDSVHVLGLRTWFPVGSFQVTNGISGIKNYYFGEHDV